MWFKERVLSEIKKVYKKSLGKAFREEAIQKNKIELHTAITELSNKCSEVAFYCTSKKPIDDECKKFTKSMQSEVITYLKKSEIYGLLKITLLFSIFSAAVLLIALINAMFFNLEEFGRPSYLAGLCLAVFLSGGLSAAHIFMRNYLIKKINDTSLEKKEIKGFLNKYKKALGLQETSLFFVDRTSEKTEEHRVEDIDYDAIKKVILTAEDEKIQFSSKYSSSSSNAIWTAIETDKYKTAKIRILNLLMPDNTVLSIAEPVGPNGEDIEELRDIIEGRMLGTPMNGVVNSIQSEDKITA